MSDARARRFNIRLLPFRASHLDLLAAWLRLPHVSQWYPDVERELAWAINLPPGASQVLLACQRQAIGYLRWRVDEPAALPEPDAGSRAVTVDVLIGSTAHVGHGIGPKVLNLLASRFSADTGVPLMVAAPSIDNAAAQRALHKAGFARRLPVTADRRVVMVRDLAQERAAHPAALVRPIAADAASSGALRR